MKSNRTLKGLLLAAALVVAALGLAACGGTTTVTAPASTTTVTAPTVTTTVTTTQMPASVMTMMMANHEAYLTDAHGMTLYYFTHDEEGMSNAGAAIIANWPVFYDENMMVSMDLDGMDFGTITRSDGAKQTTFRGFPLYYYSQDMMAGEANGEGINDAWFTVNPDRFAPPRLFNLVDGWYKGQPVTYYDFGMNTPFAANDMVQTSPIYVLITGMDMDGNPVFVAGQHNIVDDLPGDSDYSDLWNVTLVTVPMGYVPDSIRSFQEIENAGFDMTTTDLFVNCPIVPAGSTLASGKTLVQGWFRGQPVYYPDYGLNPPEVAPIYALITGMDAQGNPMFVDGQKNIIDVKPGDMGYSAFWDVQLVTVPSGYLANTLKSAADVMASGYPMADPGLLVNCPVVEPQ